MNSVCFMLRVAAPGSDFTVKTAPLQQCHLLKQNDFLLLRQYLDAFPTPYKERTKVLRHSAGKRVKAGVNSSLKSTRERQSEKSNMEKQLLAQSWGPTLFGVPWEKSLIRRFSPSSLKLGVLMGWVRMRVHLTLSPSSTVHPRPHCFPTFHLCNVAPYKVELVSAFASLFVWK